MRCNEYQNKQYSDIFSEKAERYYLINSSKIKKSMVFFEKHENGKILDIGCGDGKFSKMIAKKTGAKVFGLDISDSCIESAKKRGINAKKFDIDGSTLPFDDKTFDAIFCGDTIEHIFDTDKLTEEIFRMLKPNGYLVISIPNINAWYNRGLTLAGYLPVWVEPTSGKFRGTPFMEEGCGHIRAFNKHVLKAFLEDKGFNVEKMKGAHAVAGKEFGRKKSSLWNKTDSFFSRFVGLSSFVIAKAKKGN